MVRLNRNIRAVQLALYQRPEVFQRVRVHLPANVFDCMVDYFMLKMLVESGVRPECIRVECSASLDMLMHQVMHIASLALVDNLRADLSSALQEPDNRSLVFFHIPGQRFAAMLVHVPSFTANKGLIYLNSVSAPAELRGVKRVLHRKTKALEHKPCRLLRDAKRAVNLHAGNTVLAVRQHPVSNHPLVESKRRVLKYRVDLERELLVARTAEPQLPRLDEVVLIGAATRANDLAVRPAQLAGILKAAVRIGEVNDGFL